MWEHNWIEGEQFLHNNSCSSISLVSDLINQEISSWIFPVIKKAFEPRVVNEIHSIPIPSRDVEEFFVRPFSITVSFQLTRDTG